MNAIITHARLWRARAAGMGRRARALVSLVIGVTGAAAGCDSGSGGTGADAGLAEQPGAGANSSAPPAPSAGGTTPDVSARWLANDGTTGNPGFTGVLTLNEYDWGCCTNGYLGVIQLDLASGTKRRVLDGGDPARHPDGTTSFWQYCGTGVNRLAVADAAGVIDVVSPCSEVFDNPGDSPTYFGFSRLSPDGQRVAVEVIYDIYFEPSHVMTRVYDLEGTVLAEFEDHWAPTWTPDGRLVLVGEGLYLTDAALSAPERIDGEQLQGPVNNPSVHPMGDRVVFEYNQQLWEMKLDGTELRQRVSGAARLRFPTYSPGGESIAYLSTAQEDYYDRAIYFTDLERDQSYSFDVRNIIGNTATQTSVVPRGPLSWTLP